jgi:endoglucanase Acf2
MDTRILGLYVLVITGIIAIIAFIFVITSVYFSESDSNGSGGNTGNTGTTGFVCSGPGTIQYAPAPKYKRMTPKSTCKTPLSNQSPIFDTVQHTVDKLYRIRSLKGPISPNHWGGNAMHGDENIFCVYPYIGSILATGFVFSWPGNGILTQDCGNTGTCSTGYADLSYNIGWGPKITIGNNGSQVLSCDIINFDAMTTTVAWQFFNPSTGKTGSLTLPLVKGSPYITIESVNSSISLECDFTVDLKPFRGQSSYILKIDATTGYVIFFPHTITLTDSNNIISVPRVTASIRIAYYNSQPMLNILSRQYSAYPVESTISTSLGEPGSSWDTTSIFTWTPKNIFGPGVEDKLLMMALPHHNIENVIVSGPTGDHPVIGPYRFVITNNNTWILNYSVVNYDFTYPPITASGITGMMIPVWKNELEKLIQAIPSNTVDWCRWLGSIAILFLIGDMLKQNINTELDFLESQLSLLQTNKGAVSASNTIVTDITWGGVISNIGLTNCQGTSDEGNAFYENHIGQYGYLVFAYAVAGYFDPTFLDDNKETALYFVRNIANPAEADKTFPLWRNKDWYFGYSLSSGLTPNQAGGKNTNDIAEIIMGYFGTYLMSMLITNRDLTTWSLSMLAMEISALKHYFQIQDVLTVSRLPQQNLVNPAFVQGTITDRGDVYYQYTTVGGNDKFPERNASIMVSMIKPLLLISDDYIDPGWAVGTQPWMIDAINNNIQPESLGYAESLIAVNNTNANKRAAIQTIILNSNNPLPYGSTWSSMLYWIASSITD